VRFIYKHKENMTAPTRDGEYGHGELLADVENCDNDFSVIKPHFSRWLSRLFFSAGSQLSRIFAAG